MIQRYKRTRQYSIVIFYSYLETKFIQTIQYPAHHYHHCVHSRCVSVVSVIVSQMDANAVCVNTTLDCKVVPRYY